VTDSTLELSPYQETGARYLAAHPRCGLFDEPGAGKTPQVVRALDIMQIKGNILVICPAIARANWCAEFLTWQTIDRKPIACRDIHDIVAWQKGRRDILVVSYEQARRWADVLKSDIIDALCVDESHYLKNPTAARTKAVLGENCDRRGGIAGMAGTLWQLTGTPLPNDSADSWTFLRSVDAVTMTRSDYVHRFFRSHQGSYKARQTPRNEMLQDLQYIHRTSMIRRTLAEVGYQLPPMRISTIDIDGDTKEIRDMLRQHPGLEKAVLAAVERGGISASFLDAQHLGTLRRLVAEAKSIPVAELVAGELESGLDKIVIMGIHISALENVANSLNERGFKAVLVNGSTPDKKRNEHIAAFQNDPTVRVFVANIQSASTAVTLHSAQQILMLESDWSPANNYQALKRVHRRGQNRPVLARFVRLINSIDEEVQTTIAKKTRDIAAVGISSVVEETD
jgi:SWI/SNF-related matrix-associated actin-dependent regulator 1 of chromatin subfamily A